MNDFIVGLIQLTVTVLTIIILLGIYESIRTLFIKKDNDK